MTATEGCQDPQETGIVKRCHYCNLVMTAADWWTVLYHAERKNALDQMELIAAEMMAAELEMDFSRAVIMAAGQKHSLPQAVPMADD